MIQDVLNASAMLKPIAMPAILPRWLLLLFLITMTTTAAPSADHAAVAQKARATLQRDLETLQGWQRIHVAETLIALGAGEAAARAFEADKNRPPQEGFEQIGIWRVLAASAATPQEREEQIAQIEGVFLNPQENRRLHSLETLGKLGVVPQGALLEGIRAYIETATLPDAVFGHWVVALTGDQASIGKIVAALEDEAEGTRLRAAFALKRLGVDTPTALRNLDAAARRESPDSVAFAFLLGAAYALNADPAAQAERKAQLRVLLEKGGPANARYEAAQCLLGTLSSPEAVALAPLLEHEDYAARAGAAWLILENAPQ